MRRSSCHTKNISRRFFSLVEMLVVIAIIAILVGLGAGGYTVARRWMAQSKTEALLAKLKIALESYKNDKGYYPLPHTGTSPSSIPNFRLDVNIKDFAELHPGSFATHLPNINLTSSDNDHLQTRNNMSSFMDYAELRENQSIKVEQTDYYEYFAKDGWNTPNVSINVLSKEYSWGAIKYRCPGLVNKTTFDLYSAGPDRVFAADPAVDTEDDIYAKF